MTADSALPAHLRTAPASSDAKGAAAAIVLVDGEHYPQTVADAIALLVAAGWDIRGAALIGGTEKLRSGADGYGVPVVTGDGPVDATLRAIDRFHPEWVLDLSDEPVLVIEERMHLMSIVAEAGCTWAGADMVVHAPAYGECDAPSLAVIGTGKRIGKTAVGSHIATVADQALGGGVIVVAMGRGGPADPVVIDRRDGPMTVDRLLAISREGLHAASDYLEDAALSGVTTIGCRRAGGGMLGAPVTSNVQRGAGIAASLGPSLVVFEGSGQCIPPVRCDRTILLASTGRPQDLVGGFGHYRIARSDLVLIVGDDVSVGRDMARYIQSVASGVVAVPIRLRPQLTGGDIGGARVAAFTTAPATVVEPFHDACTRIGGKLVALSHDLARRDVLRGQVNAAIAAGTQVFAVEIKAAAIDVVAEAADSAGIPIVFIENRPVPHDSAVDLDGMLVDLARAAVGSR